MENNDYIVTELKGAYDSKFPDSKKYVFRVEGYDNDLSVFSKFPITVGQEITGRIEINGQYHNFKWGKKASTTFQKGGTAPDANRLEAKTDAIRAQLATIGAEITAMKGVLSEILQKISPIADEPF
jgi:hypothetical protein